MSRSIESEVAEAAYLIFISPEANAQMADRPELFWHWMHDLCPTATPVQIERGMEIAAELLTADLAEMRDQFHRGTLVLPETVT